MLFLGCLPQRSKSKGQLFTPGAYTTCRPADADGAACRHVLLLGVLLSRPPSFTSQCCRRSMTDSCPLPAQMRQQSDTLH